MNMDCLSICSSVFFSLCGLYASAFFKSFYQFCCVISGEGRELPGKKMRKLI